MAGLAETDGYSTTIEAFNGSARGQAFAVRLRSGQGVLLGVREGLELAAGESRHWSVSELFPQARGEALTLELSADAGSALPLSTVAVTDLRTESAVAFAPERPASRAYVPVSGRVAGAGDTFVSSDIAVCNPSEKAVTVRVGFLQRDLDNTVSPAATLRLAPRQTRVIADVVGALFGLSEVSGFLEVVSDEPGVVLAASRMARSEGGPGSVGAATQPVFPERFSMRSVVREPATGQGRRSAVGLLNPADSPLAIVLRWLDLGGRIVAETTSVIPARGTFVVPVESAAARWADVLVIEGDGPHFAFPAGVDRIGSAFGRDPGPGADRPMRI